MEFLVEPVLAQRIGHTVVRTGWLRAIREHIGLSCNAMATALNTYPATYRSWENTDKGLRSESAATIGRFYLTVLTQLHRLDLAGYRPSDLVPLTQVAIKSGIALPAVRDQCDGDRCVDLGPLGIFVTKGAARSWQVR